MNRPLFFLAAALVFVMAGCAGQGQVRDFQLRDGTVVRVERLGGEDRIHLLDPATMMQTRTLEPGGHDHNRITRQLENARPLRSGTRTASYQIEFDGGGD